MTPTDTPPAGPPPAGPPSAGPPSADPPPTGPVTADAIAAAVLACGTVADLAGGLAGEVATYLPGRRVTGVQTRPDGVTVHVVAHYGPTMAEVAGDVAAAVRAVAGPVDVRVGIDDLLVP